MTGKYDYGEQFHRTLWITAGTVTSMFSIILLLFAWIEINGAVVASGIVIVKTYGKHIQHPDGGIISEILVEDGSEVKEGDVLLRLDDTIVRVDLEIVSNSISKFEARKARLEAERDHLVQITFPEHLLGLKDRVGIAQLLRSETDYFNFRRSNLASKVDQLRERIRQLREEIVGHEAQKRSKDEQFSFTVIELDGVKHLVEEGHAPLTRQLALDKSRADFEGQAGELVAKIAQCRGRIAEVELAIVETNETFQTDAIRDLRDVDGQLNELRERQTAAEDKLKRIEIRSPRFGIVHDLGVHTIGGVIKAAEKIMTIVPKEEDLVIEAKVSVDDIDQVQLDQDSYVRFTSLNRKRTPELTGKVSIVGADSLQDQYTKRYYYPVRITFSETEFAELYDIKARPGMLAEVHIRTDERNVLSYLLKPLADEFRRALIED